MMASSLAEDVADSKSLAEAWKKFGNFYRNVEAKRNFQKCTASQLFSILDGDVEGHTKYLPGIHLPIMINSIWNENDCIPSRVAEMHIG